MVKPYLENIGYTYFSHKKDWSGGCFVKKINDMYLTLGMNIHRYYDSMFTCDMYFSTNTRIGCLWGDMPRSCYFRPCMMLSECERFNLFNEKYSDIWFDATKENSFKMLIKSILITEKKISSNKQLIHSVKNSMEIRELTNTTLEVIKFVDKLINNKRKNEIPTKEYDNIPAIWIYGAEVILKDLVENNRTVLRTAADAYRIYELNKILSPL